MYNFFNISCVQLFFKQNLSHTLLLYSRHDLSSKKCSNLTFWFYNYQRFINKRQDYSDRKGDTYLNLVNYWRFTEQSTLLFYVENV